MNQKNQWQKNSWKAEELSYVNGRWGPAEVIEESSKF